jgi:hypothetical protein
MNPTSISSRSRRRPARLAAATRIVRVVRGSCAMSREPQATDRRPRCMGHASPLANHYPPVIQVLIGSAAISYLCNSHAISTRCISNRYKYACLRVDRSRSLHSANRQPQRRTTPLLIAGEKILKTELTPSVPIPNAFLIAGDFPTFSPAAACISNRYSKLLEIELTRSQQTRKHFLIAIIRPIFTSAPHPTHHLSLITHHCLTSFLFDTNKPHKIIILARLPMKTKEKQRSIRYKFALRAAGAQNSSSPITAHQSLITPHKSQVTNRDSRYNCASLSATGQSNRQPRSAAGHRHPARHEAGFGLRSSNIAALKRTTHEPAR